MKSAARFQFALAATLTAIFAGCNQNPQELKQKTAKTTQEVKSDVKAVVDGVRDGLSSGNHSLDLNSASKDQLSALPGMNSTEADRVIAGRPYQQPSDLLTRHIIPPGEYDKIAGKVTTKESPRTP